MKTVLKMLTGLAWLLHSRRASCPPVAALRPPSREALLAAAAHHRRAAAKCDVGDEEGRALHEKHAERYMVGACGSSCPAAHDPVFDRMHHVTWAEMRDGLHWQRLALEGGGP